VFTTFLKWDCRFEAFYATKGVKNVEIEGKQMVLKIIIARE